MSMDHYVAQNTKTQDRKSNKQDRRLKKGIKWQLQDSRQEDDMEVAEGNIMTDLAGGG